MWTLLIGRALGCQVFGPEDVGAPPAIPLQSVERSSPIPFVGNPSRIRVQTAEGEPVATWAEKRLEMGRLWPTAGTWPSGRLVLVSDVRYHPVRGLHPHGESRAFVSRELQVVRGPSHARRPTTAGWFRQHPRPDPGYVFGGFGPTGTLSTTVTVAPGTVLLEVEDREHGLIARRDVTYDGETVELELVPSRCGTPLPPLPYGFPLELRVVAIDFQGRRRAGRWTVVGPSTAVEGADRLPDRETMPPWERLATSSHTETPARRRLASCSSLRPLEPPQRVRPAPEGTIRLTFDGDTLVVEDGRPAEAPRTIHDLRLEPTMSGGVNVSPENGHDATLEDHSWGYRIRQGALTARELPDGAVVGWLAHGTLWTQRFACTHGLGTPFMVP
ncbi:MAG: hypothetical protein KC656_13390 [Myxococcales bacterium]|nr:hypothetical protein [Myxococcales bacterium]